MEEGRLVSGSQNPGEPVGQQFETHLQDPELSGLVADQVVGLGNLVVQVNQIALQLADSVVVVGNEVLLVADSVVVVGNEVLLVADEVVVVGNVVPEGSDLLVECTGQGRDGGQGYYGQGEGEYRPELASGGGVHGVERRGRLLGGRGTPGGVRGRFPTDQRAWQVGHQVVVR